MRRLFFTPSAELEFDEWRTTDKKIFQKITELLEAACNDPFRGIGKPEPLKHQLSGCWSRRINKEHRLVYQVTSDAVIVISCRFHY